MMAQSQPSAAFETITAGNTENPASAQSCAELLPGYAGDACQEEQQDGAFTCWCSSDRCRDKGLDEM